MLYSQGIQSVGRDLVGLHRVDHIVLDGLQIGVREIAGEEIDLHEVHNGTLALCHQLNALAGGVCTLVELTGQCLDGKDSVSALGQFRIDVIHLRLGENVLDCLLEGGFVQALCIIAVDHAQAG